MEENDATMEEPPQGAAVEEPASPPRSEAPAPESPPVSPMMETALECVSQSSEDELLDMERKIAERRQKLVGNPRTHGLRYKAVRRAQLRATIDIDSQKMGALDEHDVVAAQEVRVNEAGIVRVLCTTVDDEGNTVVRGWASAQSVESEPPFLASAPFCLLETHHSACGCRSARRPDPRADSDLPRGTIYRSAEDAGHVARSGWPRHGRTRVQLD